MPDYSAFGARRIRVVAGHCGSRVCGMGVAPLAMVIRGNGLATNRTDREQDYGIDQYHAHSPPPRRSWRGRCNARRNGRCQGSLHASRRADRSDQGRHSAFALRHHGDQRDHAEGRHADADRAAERQGRRAGPQAGSGRGRSRLQLAAVRREGARPAVGGQVRRGVRLLDLGVAQVGAAGVRGTERHPVLSGAVRRPGVQPQRVLHRCRAEPAGDPGGRLPDERRAR